MSYERYLSFLKNFPLSIYSVWKSIPRSQIEGGPVFGNLGYVACLAILFLLDWFRWKMGVAVTSVPKE